MSWFKRNKNESIIPPVETASSQVNRTPSSKSATPSYDSAAPSYSSAAPSYRSAANTYIPSRDGDLADPRSYGRSMSDFKQSSGSSYEDDTSSYGGSTYVADSASTYDKYGSSQSGLRNGGGYGARGVVSDPYARGERNLDADRNALFSGSAPTEGSRNNRFHDGPSPPPAPVAGQETEEDVEAIKSSTRFLKNETVSSTRNALRIAREAEEVGRATLLRLGEQSEKIADTERHIDVSKGHALRAEDNTDEIHKLNRSIFIPAITFNKDKKRMAQERKRELRHQEEMYDREVQMQELRDSQNRVGRATTYGQSSSGATDEEGIGGYGGRRQLTSVQQAERKEQRKRYQFEATESDDEIEDEIDDNLDEIRDATRRLKALGLGMDAELRAQKTQLERITEKTDKLTWKVETNTHKLNRIAK